ncbi:MAG TPA: hypothetical protein VMW76_01925 [Bacteroidales bacterium]|nr:hypothetical protein [Bacteroidales bacterium]
MKYILTISVILMLTISCKNTSTEELAARTGDEFIEVADNIIYDVIIKVPSQDDPWEIEKLSGYKGDEMVSTIFDAIYNGDIEVYEYHSGDKLSLKDLEQLEQVPGFERENIGKIQFTEKWYFNKTTLQIEKEVMSIVLGYETRDPADGTLIGYKAAFKLDLK